MLKFFTFSFWFSQQAYQPWILITFLVIALVLLLLGVLVLRKRKQLKKDGEPAFRIKHCKKVANLFFVIGVLILLVDFFAYQNTIFFSMRFWFLLLFVVFIWRFWWLFQYKKKVIPRLTEERQAKQDMDKYMPKTKKRK